MCDDGLMSTTASVDDPTTPVWVRAIKLVTVVGAVMFGLGMILIAVTIGRCSAFGGSCSGDAPPILGDDVFGMAAFGAAIVIGVPIALTGPWRRRVPVAFGAAVVAALVVGLLARSIAHG